MDTSSSESFRGSAPSSGSVVKLEFTCTKNEVAEAEELSMRHRWGGGSRWKTFVVLLAVIAVAGAFIWLAIHQMVPAPYRIYAVIGFLAIWMVMFYRIRRQKRKAPILPIKLEFSTDGIAIGEVAAQATVPWSAYAKLIESEKVLLLLPRSVGVGIVIPRRVIPSDRFVPWLRDAVEHQSEAAPPPRIPAGAFDVEAESSSSDEIPEIGVQCRPNFLDLLDMNAASWMGRGWMIGFGLMWLATGVSVLLHRTAGAKFTRVETLCYFIIPMSLILPLTQLPFMAFHSWLSRGFARPQTLLIGRSRLTMCTQAGTATVPITTYTRFKETRRAFLIWGKRGVPWLLLPKRGFESKDSLRICRELLMAHLQHSTWFFGH